ncbi:glycosyltransferase family 1 protein [Hyphomicrobium sp. CS1BSMeth3]|uniref:glycosyltransferase family 4 protein n=1 Tax=Hyphomicrobium sp. CS1BSMeth3 TaxID=1892844 RepID=UPI001AECD527|nr:glycosyltransferase family 1 protein [Hyphomicrobium sp. CS1BSMeth3]
MSVVALKPMRRASPQLKLLLPEKQLSLSTDCEILLDLSRLLSRVLHPTPTGVDRVEMAYALGLLRIIPDQIAFALIHPAGPCGRVSRGAAVDFLHLTAERWRLEGQDETTARRWRRAAAACLKLLPRPQKHRAVRSRIYLHCSSRGLERRSVIERLLAREQARFLPFVHDIIPLEHPEYARPSGAALFRRKFETVVALASGVLANSEATKRAIVPLLAASGRTVPVRALPLGVPDPFDARGAQNDSGTQRPYFLAIATIEPRKNHLLLLHVWRRMIATMAPEAVPRLVLVGRRGWENEMVLDLLDRTPSFSGVVEEYSRVPDGTLRELTLGARAVLLPSFSEGYGLPVAEALSLGVPVIASDLPALREAGGDVPEYLDPLDGTAWLRTILDYMPSTSARRAAQLSRLAGWQSPSWDTHLKGALAFIAEMSR